MVAPARYDLPGWRRYLAMAWQALTARGRFDGVEGHFVLPSGVIALLAARLRRLPLVVYAHGGDVRDMAARNRVFRWLAQRVVRGADAVVTNSAETAALVRGLGADATVIPPGIDLSRFSPSPRPAERRVLYLGGDVPAQGRRRRSATCGHAVRARAFARYHPTRYPQLLAAHDVLLVPSREEPFGLVAAEAIASGRWVVARAVGGLREIVTDGENGFLVERRGGPGGRPRPRAGLRAVAWLPLSAERFSVEAHAGDGGDLVQASTAGSTVPHTTPD